MTKNRSLHSKTRRSTTVLHEEEEDASKNNNNTSSSAHSNMSLLALGSLGLLITVANSESVVSHFLPSWWGKDVEEQEQHEHQSHETIDAAAATVSNSIRPNATSSPTPYTCRSYLAPSTLPGAGLGLFAGTFFQQGQVVTPGDAVVPLLDIDWNNYYKTSNIFLWDDYIWSGSTFPKMTDNALYMDIDGASFGIGAIPNCHFGLLNVEETIVQYDPHTSNNNGAYTPWHGREGIATEPIQAGQEIFVDYGYGYFEGSRTETIGHVPFNEDFVVADALLHTMQVTLQRLHEWDPAFEEETDVYATVQSMLKIWPNRVAMALPTDIDEIPRVLAQGGTAKKDLRLHSLAFLQEYGTCTDYLRAGPSTIPHAGRGAFSVRDFSPGDVVAPVPMIHLPERSVLHIHDWGLIDTDDGEPFWKDETNVRQQLLLNYCWGHPETTLLLCPYGVVSSLVNHASSSDNANVKMVWSNKTTVHPEWKDMPIQEWAYDNGSGLCMEYIATRDISAGDEILIDYGDAWQTAWDSHAYQEALPPLLMDALNALDDDSKIPTEQEWTYSQGDPMVDSQAVTLWCYSAYREMQGLPIADEKAYPCKVVLRNDQDNTYTAEIVARLQNKNGEETPDATETYQCFEVFDEVLWNIPRDALAYGGPFDVDSPRQHLHALAFRHEMLLPETLLPLAWRNKKEE